MKRSDEERDGRRQAKLAAVCCGLAAVVWTVFCVVAWVYTDELLLRAGSVVCALVWWGAFAVRYLMYRWE